MEVTIKAWETRNVTARDLSRRISQLLNEIEETGTALVVLRYGQPAAMLVPLEPKPTRTRRRVAIEQREEKPFEMPELEPADRDMLAALAKCAPEPFRPNEVSTATTCVRLELNGLAESDGGNYWLTADGERVAAKLTA